MEIVNGYICMNCCDVDKARLGVDPHQTTNQIQKQLDRHIDKLTPGKYGPAVTFGGSLQATTPEGGADTANTTAGTPQTAQAGNPPAASSVVDLFA